MTPSSQIISVPVFAGHGTNAIASRALRDQAVHDASNPAAAFLLSACYDAFQQESASLPSEVLDIPSFTSPQDFLNSIVCDPPVNNALLSSLSLFLVQVLRYYAHVEASSTPFSHHLTTNSNHGLGLLGFSSGILPACAVACSPDRLSFIRHTVQIFRFAFWLGLRCHQYTNDDLSHCKTRRSWSRVVIGIPVSELTSTLDAFNAKTPTVYLTAITNDTTMTVSGPPEILDTFVDLLRPSCRILTLPVDTLYHAPIHKDGVRKQVLADVERRNIKFPTTDDLCFPLRSTFTGEIIDVSCSLLEAVTDMILTQPVNWDKVTSSLFQAFPGDVPVSLLNFGPGTGLARNMAKSLPLTTTVDLSQVPSLPSDDGRVPIAIVGMAINMPGAPDVAKLWKVLEEGINTVSEVPMERFNVSEYNRPSDKASKRAMKAHTGNFIADPSLFDAHFFRISPREAKSMDPQQRILLHTAYEALENAGYVPDATPTFQKDTFGCYVGVATDDYIQNLRDEIDVYYSTGTLRAFLSGRISYAMGWSGPSIVIDTACSSSMVSLYQACRALSNNDCNAAIAGGVNIITSPDMMIGLDRGHFLSPTGQCKAFDASADGYSRSEGCGLFVLKRLSDAIAENDNILGVIRGIEVNQSGNAHSITHPHAPTQVKLFGKLLDKAGVDSHRVNVIEAHGTGTQAGDPNELESIRRTFCIGRPKSNPLHITSIKANIGHLEAASGAAGLAKLLLMLRHKTIPRLISLKNLNPLIAPLDTDTTVIDTVASQWEPSEPGIARLSMLNNFGAAGSNGALLLEEYSQAPRESSTPSTALPFCLSAKDARALEALRQRYVDYLKLPENENVDLGNLAYTMTARRQIYSSRLAITASTRQELIDKLQQAVPAQTTSSADVGVAFVFSGQGGQYVGMGADLYKTCPLFKRHLDECRDILLRMGFNDILSVILPSGVESGDEFEVYQTAVFSLEYSLAQLWMSWGLKPKAVIGHSLGEYAALVIAGVLSLRSALFIVASRVRLMLRTCALGTTGMIAVNIDPPKMAEVLASSADFDCLSIACYNSVSDCVVAGPHGQLKSLKARLDSELRFKNTILNVPFGYHSPAMKPLVRELDAVAETIRLSPPTIPIVSNVFGSLIEPRDSAVFTHTYFSRHCVEPVRFSEGFAMLLADAELSSSIWIEIGPHPTTLPMMKACPALPKNVRLLPSLRKQQDPWTVLSSSLCSLFLETSHVMWRDVYNHLGHVTCVDLPSYPFAPSKFWVAFRDNQPKIELPAEVPGSDDLVSEFSLLRSWVQRPSPANGNLAIFDVPISSLAKLITGHMVGDYPLCPASVYHELAMAAIRLSTEERHTDRHIVLRDIDYAKPLVYAKEDARSVRTSISLDNGTFSVFSVVPGESTEQTHCNGKFVWESTRKASQKFLQYIPVLNREIAAVDTNEEAELFSARTAYEIIFPRVVHYSKQYHSMRSLTVHPSGMDAHATIKVPHAETPGKYVVHPVFMDTLLHVAGFVANMQASTTEAYICSQVDCVKILPEVVDYDATYEVFCRNAWLPEDGLILADAYAVTSGSRPQIVAHLKRMHFRKVRLASLKRALNLVQGGGTQPHPSSATVPAPIAQRSAAPPSRGMDVVNQVRMAVAETCDLPISTIEVTSDLSSLGVDSLMSIEILSRLQTLFPAAQLDAHAFASLHTITEIAAEVASKGGLATEQACAPIAPIVPIVSEEDILESVRKAVADTCDLPVTAIDDSADLASLGVDSLMRIEIFSRLQSLFANTELDVHVLSSLSTVQEIVAEVRSKRNPSSSPATSTFSSPRSCKTVIGEETVADCSNVKTVIADILGIDAQEFSDDTNLECLGLDSLSSIEVMQAAQNTLSVSLPQDLFAAHRTVRDLNDFVLSKQHCPLSGALTKALQLDQMPLPLLQVSGSATPLFLIHDGSGLVNYYGRMRMTDIKRSVWGIFNPNFATSAPWDDLQSMAAEYASVISQSTKGDVLIGGWSFGGVVAYEAARQLMRMKNGRRVRGVVLIDSPSPVNHVPLSSSLIDVVVNLDQRLSKSEVARLVKAQFQMNSAILGKYQPSTDGPHPSLVLLRSSEGLKLKEDMEIPTWLSDRSDAREAVAGWQQLVGTEVRVMDIPGNHFEPFSEANIPLVSQRVAAACEYLESLE
ncbi:Type I Iterative PKS [Marasmius oreades]|uniref:Type I Iterative PKS n=1 Tax=Marasmius oreades TaxID=181124 RepID=A0A9P7V1V0_9AGAR|nr:Type I Iterative PKS [Marasmius oreades]KAG7098798.1 Type I Iterative PKS [Marasmius oreades]